MKFKKEILGNTIILLGIILIIIFQLVKFVYPEPLTIENIFSKANIKETLLAFIFIGIIFGPIYYLWSMKPKYGEQEEKSKNGTKDK